MSKLSVRLRQLGFGICFTLFGFGGLILSYVIFPLIFICERNKLARQDLCQWWISVAFQGFVWFMNFVGVLSIDVHHKERFVTNKGALVVANHPTLIDVVIIIGQLRQCDCIVKASLWKNPFIRHVIQMAGYIPNDSEDILDICESKMSSGRKLLVFPEGTRTTPNSVVKCQRGAAQLAIRCNTDIQRVLITSNPATLYKGIAWYDVPQIKPQIDVVILECESTQALVDCSRSTPIAARRLTRYFEASLEPSLKPEQMTIEDYVLGNFTK
ncbi:lysophospholipid acyltransferase family protein [Vibrio sp. 10N]|nr:lysophospholipid acyltransferase family protein [Vibrio sp. 10N]